jgi:hypothetical protein
VGDTFWVQKRSAPIAAAGTVVQLNDTAPTSHRWNLAAVEILAPARQVFPTSSDRLKRCTVADHQRGPAVGSVTTQPSATAPVNTVISQSPTGGTRSRLEAPSISSSPGPQTVNVPNVVAQTQATAQSQITGAGLTVGAVTTQPSATAPVNTVLSQSPTGGTQVAAGSAVNLVVSSGPQTVGVPNLVGQTRSAAQTLITNAGLAVGAVTIQPSATAPINTVISQSPTGGSQVAAGSAVNLVVSSGHARPGARRPSTRPLPPTAREHEPRRPSAPRRAMKSCWRSLRPMGRRPVARL